MSQEHNLASAADFDGKQILITGGLGFIGSNLAHVLVSAGAKVTILDALLPAYGGSKFNIADIEDKITLVDGNILDETLLNKTVANKDYIFHLAGQVGYVDAKDKPFLDLDYNGRGMLIILEAMRNFAPQARLLFSSSRLVYGKITEVPVKENHPTEPLSLYGIHKLLGEKYIGYYSHNFGASGVSVRIPNPYGPRQQMKHSKYSIVGWFLRQAMENQTISIFGDGQQLRDYIYIDDIVTALLRLIVKGESGQAYNIGSGHTITFTQMVDTIIQVVGQGKKQYVSWPADYELNETGDYLADISKIQVATAWKPQITLAEGIQRMFHFYQENKKNYW